MYSVVDRFQAVVVFTTLSERRSREYGVVGFASQEFVRVDSETRELLVAQVPIVMREEWY